VGDIFVNVSVSDTSQMYGFTDFDRSLVGWWRMDNDSSVGENGSLVYDWAPGTKNNGTVVNAIVNTTGKFGGGYSFDGSGDEVIISNDASLFKMDELAISVWAKYAGTERSNEYNLVDAWDNGDLNYLFRFDDGSGINQIEFFTYTSSQIGGGFASTDMSDGNWHHIVAVYNGSTMLVYFDGSVSGTTFAQTGTISQLASPATNVSIGGQISVSNDFWNGIIDEVLIFNRSLSADEIWALYNATNISATGFNNNYTNLAEGTHTFRSYVVDSVGFMNSTETRSVTVDTLIPLISYTTGTPATNSFRYVNDIFVNVSVSDATPMYGFTDFE